MKLDIETTYSKIGVKSIPGRVYIKSNRDFSMKKKLPRMRLKTGKAKLEIDWRKTKYDLGIKTIKQLNRDHIKKSIDKGLKATGKIAKEGDRLARIEDNNYKVIARIARENFNDKLFNGNVGLIPQHPPDINIIRSGVKTELDWGRVDVIKKEVFSKISGEPGKTRVYLKEKGMVEVTYRGNKVNIKG
ncbi:DUF6470 family protein [Halothermothrix orenii]|uniref:Uncharacterized protein n=1 Tax=Halothermothrix orenii (strain H 168 / OCM 544 / DSM 9562) TaxID=373903 RepID=B8CYU1_HALOH|nr:DUF6470 family protein [Halothermothrix orenii]ACL70460.1 hypothetical protein Hore_17110 [Halothermothrix orenii H 168]